MITKNLINKICLNCYKTDFNNLNCFRSNKNKIDQVTEELSYLRKTFGVRVSASKISWKSKNVVIDGLDFGRFEYYHSFNLNCSFIKSTSNRIIKHPHARMSSKYKTSNCFTDFCSGDVRNQLSQFNFYNAYQIFDAVIRNVNLDHAKEMSDYHSNNLIEACLNLEVNLCGHIANPNGGCGIKWCDEFNPR